MRFKTPTREEILTGPVLSVITRIGAPAALGSLIFTFYNLADAFWVGRLPLDDAGAALAGIQVSWPFVWLLISFIGGFAGAAASAFVAQYTGAGRPREANLALNQLVLLSAAAASSSGSSGSRSRRGSCRFSSGRALSRTQPASTCRSSSSASQRWCCPASSPRRTLRQATA